MFESILIRPNSNRQYPVDFGQVIENLFFYQQTVVHINRSGIIPLLRLADIPVLEELLKYQGLSLFYNNSYSGVGQLDDATCFVDTFGLFDFDIEKELYEQCFLETSDESKSKKFSKKLGRLIKTYELPKDLNTKLNEQLHDKALLQSVLDETIKHYYPQISTNPADRRYELEFLGNNRFKIHTNLKNNDGTPFHTNSPVLALINACEDLHVMSEIGSEVCLPDFNSKIVRLKVESLLNKTQESKEKISRFNTAIFNEARALREAINEKRLHVKAVLPVLRNANRYKQWLRDISDDNDLMYEYLQKIEERSVLEYVGFKSMRFYFFNTLPAIITAMAPVVGIPISVATAAFDAFILDRLTQKWKPNQFINEEYKRLLGS